MIYETIQEFNSLHWTMLEYMGLNFQHILDYDRLYLTNFNRFNKSLAVRQSDGFSD